MISGIDVGTSQRGLDFGLAFRSGYRACYVKLGGDNVGRYTAPHYTAQIDKAHAAGFPHVGSYWVTGGYDPAGSADYYWANVRGSSFHVLDNEDLDSGRMWTDAECATFFRRLIAHGAPASSLFLYLGAAAMRGASWPQCEALGVKVIVASYGANDGSYSTPNLGGRFGNTWAGHQYTSSGNIGGVIIDLNVFQDWAFSNVSVAGGGITIIMSLSSEKYQGENAKDVPGGATIFMFVDWTLTAAKNVATALGALSKMVADFIARQDKRREEINLRNERIHGDQNEKLDAIAAAIKAGVPIRYEVDDALAELIAAKVAGKLNIDVSVGTETIEAVLANPTLIDAIGAAAARATVAEIAS